MLLSLSTARLQIMIAAVGTERSAFSVPCAHQPLRSGLLYLTKPATSKVSAISPLLSAPQRPILDFSQVQRRESESQLQPGRVGCEARWGDCVTLPGRMLAQPPLYQRAVDRAEREKGGLEGVDRKMREGWLLTAPLAHWADARVAGFGCRMI